MSSNDFIHFPSGLRVNRATMELRYYKSYDFQAPDGRRVYGVQFDCGDGGHRCEDGITMDEFEAMVFGQPARQPWYRCPYSGGLCGRYERGRR